MADATVTIVGNLTADPELRFTPNGVPVCEFDVAVNSRVRQGDEWVDGEASFYRCTAWRGIGENVAESLRKGNRILLLGNMKIHRWEAEDGTPRSRPEITVQEVGPSLRWAVTQSVRVARGRPDGDEPDSGKRGPQNRPASSRSRSSSKGKETVRTSGGSFDEDAPF
jgi:single-strand DNA-binding protein